MPYSFLDRFQTYNVKMQETRIYIYTHIYIYLCVGGQRIWLILCKYRKKIFQKLKQDLVYGYLRAAIPEKDEQMSEQREVLQVWHRTTKEEKNTKDTKEILRLTNEIHSLLEKNSRSSK